MQNEHRTQPAEVLNPEAGMYRITADPDLLAACERAIDATYAEHPYYAARFAERGRSFSTTDSGWLVHTSGQGVEHATEQIAWLSRVLASRGMPIVLLEHHLGLLADEVRAVPGNDDRANVLSQVAQQMTTQRTAVIDAQSTARLERDFDEATAAEPDRVARIGLLIVSAVADEVRGLVNVETSLRTWVADPARFSCAWIDAVDTCSKAARAAVRTA